MRISTRYWAAGYFPSIREIDRARFPSEAQLARGAGGGRASAMSRASSSPRARRSREQHALDRIHGRHISTFDLLAAEELEEGTRRAERELPAEVEVRLEQLVVAATRT